MKRFQTAFLIAASLLGIQPHAKAASIVMNGGFETGDFSGWTLSGNTDFMGVDRFLPHSGIYGASVAPVGSLGYLSQTLETVPGTSYELSFWLANDEGTPNEFQALWGGVPVVTLLDAGPFNYRNFTITLTASTVDTELRFGFRQDPRSFYFDDVAVTAIPEPASWGFVGTGIGVLLLLKRTFASAL